MLLLRDAKNLINFLSLITNLTILITHNEVIIIKNKIKNQ